MTTSKDERLREPTPQPTSAKRPRRAAAIIAWASETLLKGAAGATGGAGAATAFDLSWPSSTQAALIGGLIGIASAVAKIIHSRETSRRRGLAGAEASGVADFEAEADDDQRLVDEEVGVAGVGDTEVNVEAGGRCRRQ